MKERKSKKGKRWGSKWTRGKMGAPAPHGTRFVLPPFYGSQCIIPVLR